MAAVTKLNSKNQLKLLIAQREIFTIWCKTKQ